MGGVGILGCIPSQYQARKICRRMDTPCMEGDRHCSVSDSQANAQSSNDISTLLNSSTIISLSGCAGYTSNVIAISNSIIVTYTNYLCTCSMKTSCCIWADILKPKGSVNT